MRKEELDVVHAGSSSGIPSISICSGALGGGDELRVVCALELSEV